MIIALVLLGVVAAAVLIRALVRRADASDRRDHEREAE
jgi:type II secretory pathway pseudopilin PulG